MAGILNLMVVMKGTSAVTDATVAISPASVSATRTSTQTFNQNMTAVVSNGVGPFTYSWIWQTGGTGLTLSGTTSSVCTITSPAQPDGTTRSGTLKVTVTDTGNGSKVTTNTAPVSATWGPL